MEFNHYYATEEKNMKKKEEASKKKSHVIEVLATKVRELKHSKQLATVMKEYRDMKDTVAKLDYLSLPETHESDAQFQLFYTFMKDRIAHPERPKNHLPVP